MNIVISGIIIILIMWSLFISPIRLMVKKYVGKDIYKKIINLEKKNGRERGFALCALVLAFIGIMVSLLGYIDPRYDIKGQKDAIAFFLFCAFYFIVTSFVRALAKFIKDNCKEKGIDEK